METLFETKESYLKMRSNFKKWYNTEDNRKTLTAADFALYALIRNKDWRKCFTPNSDLNKIEEIENIINNRKTCYINLKPYGTTVTEEMITILRKRGIAKWMNLL